MIILPGISVVSSSGSAVFWSIVIFFLYSWQVLQQILPKVVHLFCGAITGHVAIWSSQPKIKKSHIGNFIESK